MLIKLIKEEHVRTPGTAAKIIANIIAAGDKIDREREQFYTIGLNSKNKIKFVELLTIGTLDSACPVPKEVARRLLIEGAVSGMVAHNHPSGDPEPSSEDKIFTKKLKDVLAIVDIPLLDHIIVTDSDKYYSFMEAHSL